MWCRWRSQVGSLASIGRFQSIHIDAFGGRGPLVGGVEEKTMLGHDGMSVPLGNADADSDDEDELGNKLEHRRGRYGTFKETMKGPRMLVCGIQ